MSHKATNILFLFFLLSMAYGLRSDIASSMSKIAI